jgi:hypothetical protein
MKPKLVVDMTDWNELVKDVECKKPLVLPTLDKDSKIKDISVDVFLFVITQIPQKIFYNKTNLATIKQEINDKKYAIDKLKADKTIKINGMSELKNQAQRDSQLVIELFDDKEFDKLRVELNNLIREKDDYENLAEYHKNLSYTIHEILSNNKLVVESDNLLKIGEKNE